MPLNDCVEVKAGGIHGFCWFAGEDIKAGTWIWKARAPGAPHTDRFFTTEQLAQLDPAVRDKFMSLAYQVEDNLYLGLDPDKEPIPAEQNELFVNHSCDGNCWYENDDLLTAMRDIKKGEEICYDYVLTEADPQWVLAPKCLCGGQNCRGKVTGNDWKIPSLQQKYHNHFLRHVLTKIHQSHQKPLLGGGAGAGHHGAGAGAGAAGHHGHGQVEYKAPAAAAAGAGSDDDGEGDEEEEVEKKPKKKAPAAKKQRAPEPEADEDEEPSRRSSRARKPTAKIALFNSRKRAHSDDDDEDFDEEVKPRPKKRGRKAKNDDDEDFQEGQSDED